MAVLTPDQKKRLGPPPNPYAVNVKIVNPDGTPTDLFHQYLTKIRDWQRKLVEILTE